MCVRQLGWWLFHSQYFWENSKLMFTKPPTYYNHLYSIIGTYSWQHTAPLMSCWSDPHWKKPPLFSWIPTSASQGLRRAKRWAPPAVCFHSSLCDLVPLVAEKMLILGINRFPFILVISKYQIWELYGNYHHQYGWISKYHLNISEIPMIIEPTTK